MAVRRVLALGLLLLWLPACRGDDGGGDASPGERSTSAGLLVGQQLADGELLDTLELIDPERPGDETVDLANVARGIPVGVNQVVELRLAGVLRQRRDRIGQRRVVQGRMLQH